jgi:hypothetical protein
MKHTIMFALLVLAAITILEAATLQGEFMAFKVRHWPSVHDFVTCRVQGAESCAKQCCMASKHSSRA